MTGEWFDGGRTIPKEIGGFHSEKRGIACNKKSVAGMVSHPETGGYHR